MATQYNIGDLVEARTRGLPHYFRARVVATGEDIVDVEFLDSGNVEAMVVEHVRALMDGVTRHSDSLLTRRKYSELAEGHERDLVHELRDYEEGGDDLDAIREHIDDAASARVWDMFLANYKCFSRTGDELQMLLPDRVRTTRHLRED